MTNVLKRLTTGVLLVILITLAVINGAYSFIALILLINLLSLLEFYRLLGPENIAYQKFYGTGLSFGLLLTIFFVSTGSSPHLLLLNIPLAYAVFINELYRRDEEPFKQLAYTFLGVIWITLPLCLLIATAFTENISGEYHGKIIAGYFCLLWSHDSFAYIFGKALGRHPLFKSLSPGKTWEGSIGGAIIAITIACAISLYVPQLSLICWLGMAMIVIFFGTYGDFVKSLLKRSLNVKDSGTLLPGHGGMLDRFDSLIGSAPFVYIYLLLYTIYA
ncbi:phosphatidate cytidylyltransferase [Mucilaginibacter puniceus]